MLISLDPGSRGGIAVMPSINKVKAVYPYFPDTLVKICKQYPHATYVTEEVKSAVRAPAGLRQTFQFGYNVAVPHGIILALTGHDPEFITPQEWKKIVNLIHQSKEGSIKLCKDLYPGIDLKRNERSKTDDHNMAESILIGRAYMIKQKGLKHEQTTSDNNRLLS